MIGWHLLRVDLPKQRRREDQLTVIGETVRKEPGRIVRGLYGYHFCRCPFTAMVQATGPWIMKAEYGGEILESADTPMTGLYVASERTVLGTCYAVEVLKEFRVSNCSALTASEFKSDPWATVVALCIGNIIDSVLDLADPFQHGITRPAPRRRPTIWTERLAERPFTEVLRRQLDEMLSPEFAKARTA